MLLEILTPDEKIFEGEVESAKFPGAAGSFQVLNNHAPLISTLEKGKISYKDNSGEHSVQVVGGLVQVLNNKITVLADKSIT